MTAPRSSGFSGLALTTGPTSTPEQVDAMLRRIVEAGADGAQLYAGEWDVVIGGRVQEARLRRFCAVVQQHRSRLPHLTLHAPIAQLNLFEDDLAFQMQQFRAWLAVAGALRCATMTYHPGRYQAGADALARFYELLRREREALASLVQDAAAEGVTIAGENLYDERWPEAEVSYSADPQCLIGTVEAVDHPCLGVCLDFGHLFLASMTQGFDYLCAVRELAPHAVVLHVHDNLGRPQPKPRVESYGGQIIRGEGDLHLPLAWGRIPFEAVFQGAHFARHPIFVAEVNERFWRDDRSVATQSLARARDLIEIAVHGRRRSQVALRAGLGSLSARPAAAAARGAAVLPH